MRTHRLWWDDFWAILSLAATIMLMTVFFAKPMEIQLFSTGRLWIIHLAARATVAVTIVRLLPEGPDITADAWLLGAPAYMLLQMNLSRRHHRLIQVIFGCDVLVTATSIVHSVFILRQDQSAVGLSGHFQVSTSLIVSNLLVVVTYVYRIFCNDVDIESSNDSTSESKHDNSPATRASNIVSVNGAGTASRLTFTVISTTNTFNSFHPFRSSRFSEPIPNRHSAAAERIIKTYFT
ncbi:hypothetical protein BDQ17DRAFT_1360592 [Cyathus striatus]|nr:hypothetical protein BDQ17DRAFT_1360592 [Cyathus striatus]